MKKVTFNIVYLAFFLLIACNRKPNSTSPGTKDPNKIEDNSSAHRAKTTPGNYENAFATNAAVGGMMEVESSVRMIKSTENPDVQTLATIMVKDHGMANDELMSIAKHLKIKLPATLPKQKTDVLAKMNNMKEDEKNLYYADLMVKEHQDAVNLFNQATKNEKDQLGAFAIKHLPTLKHHLMEAKNVQRILHSIKNDKGDYPLNTSKAEQ